jgi:hypothetical protein
MMRFLAKWASKKRQYLNPVMAISIFLPTDDRKVWSSQFISTLPQVAMEVDKQWIIPIRFDIVEASISMMYASERWKIYNVISGR